MIAKGLLAGAAGTAALDIVTYLDMMVRARPASVLPSDVTQRLAKALGIDALAEEQGDEPKNRRSGAGALLGYGVGLGAGATYAVLRPAFYKWLPWPVAGAVLGAATLVVSEGSATALGATDWSEWSAIDWASDIIPRTIYGLTVAYVVERLAFDNSSANAGSGRSLDSAPMTAAPVTHPPVMPVIPAPIAADTVSATSGTAMPPSSVTNADALVSDPSVANVTATGTPPTDDMSKLPIA